MQAEKIASDSIYEVNGLNTELQKAFFYWIQQYFSQLISKIQAHWKTYGSILPIDDPIFDDLRVFRPDFMEWPVYANALAKIVPYRGL
jgi:hypothetical protein